MTDHDNLRNRIAKAIHREECSCGEDVAEEWELRWAQAIIDEFEMQVLEVDRIDLINGTVASYQIVGKWERSD